MIRHKKWIMVAIILIVLAVLQYRNVNLNITNQTVIKYNFNLNEEITTPTFKLTPKSTNVEYVPDEEIYRIMINLEVKKTNAESDDLSLLPHLWITPKYNGANQTIDFRLDNGVIVDRNYWRKNGEVIATATFELPKERIELSNENIAFEVLVNEKKQYHRYSMQLNRNLFSH